MNIAQRTIPHNYRLIYSANTIARRTAELGAEISDWAENAFQRDHQQILAVCILRGGVFFFSDLLKNIRITVEPSFARCQSYSSSSNLQQDAVRITLSPDNLQGRDVLLIDDICDSGKTLAALMAHCRDHGARDVRTAVLIHRIHQATFYTPNYIAFQHRGAEWFAGYGMEDKNHRANYPDVYVINT